MKKKDESRKSNVYLTTGEMSALFKGMLSHSTISRLFDRGEFGGRVNPLTGRREIEWGVGHRVAQRERLVRRQDRTC
jgi:hypothetical protein